MRRAGTYFGKTAELVQTAVTVSHFQKAVLKIGNYLIMLAVAPGGGDHRGVGSIAVNPILDDAAVRAGADGGGDPGGDADGAVGDDGGRRALLAKKQAIVSKLVAIEELAGVDVLCADKTGTLTQNKLTLGDPFCLGKITADQVILAGALASRADERRHHRSGCPGRPEGQGRR
jgi:H+-transporting ATPase